MRADITSLAFAGLLAVGTAAPSGAYDRARLSGYNDLYRKGDFRAALDGYLAMAAAEPADPGAYYNAGNACFRMDKPGLAVLYYAKAFRLAPRAPDVRANLEFALRHTGQVLVPDGVPRSLHYAYYLFSDDELKAIAVLAWWSLCALIFLLAISPVLRPRLGTPAAAALALLLLSGLWLAARSSSPFSGAAVVTAQGSAPLLSGPGDTFKTYASLPEARLVKLLDENDPLYYEVGIPREGVKGWILKTAAEKI